MAIKNKLIHFKNKLKFEEELANNNILNTSICFILDTKEIWTHGTIYCHNEWSILDVPISTFSIDGVSYEFEEGMTWEEWVNSEYNTDDFIISTNNVLYKGDDSDNTNAVCDPDFESAFNVQCQSIKEGTAYYFFAGGDGTILSIQGCG